MGSEYADDPGPLSSGGLPAWEVGSFFGWDHRASQHSLTDTGGSPTWRDPSAELYASGTGAVRALIEVSVTSQRGIRQRLHLPAFFCMTTAAQLAHDGDILWYHELPDGEGPDFDSLSAVPGDLVLAANLFGRGRPQPWDDWRAANPDITVVEDHTHDPLSDWAKRSTSNYCMASLRKSLPVPDGALLWSPVSAPVPRPRPATTAGAAFKLSAMLLKAAWLRRCQLGVDEARRLERAGERLLAEEVGAAAAVTAMALDALDVHQLRSRRHQNVDALTRALQGTDDVCSPLSHSDPGSVPFNLQVVCRTPSIRDSLQEHLIRERVYAPIHWLQPAHEPNSGDPTALALAARILTLPCDHRYDVEDMERISDLVRIWRSRACRRRLNPAFTYEPPVVSGS